MALSNINKFSPYATSGNQALLFPKLKFRFRVSFSKFGGAYGIAGSGGDANNILEMSKQIVTCSRPSVTFPIVNIETYNSKIYMHGKPEWAVLTCVMRDDMSGNISKVVGQQLQKQFDFMEQASAAASGDFKFGMTIDMLDGGNGANAPTVLETWELSGCFLSEVNYGDLDYASNEATTVSLSVRFDNALQVDAADSTAVGVGIAVGRTVGNMLSP